MDSMRQFDMQIIDRIIRDNGRQRQYQEIFQLGKKTYGSRQHQNDPIKIKDGDYA